MPIRVVTNSHLTGDDTTLVPSVKEFKALQVENSQLKRELNAIKSSVSSLERMVKSIQSSVTALKTTLRTLRQDIKKELSDGEWKKILDRATQEATQQLEAAMSCVSTAGVSQLSEGIAVKMRKTNLAVKPTTQKTSARGKSRCVDKMKTTVLIKGGAKSKKK